MFFKLSDAPPFRRAVLGDRNAELVNLYAVVRDQVAELADALAEYKLGEQAYYEARDQDPAQLDEVRRAARVLYLNRTCFNGLWRVNRAGKFNVPYGKYPRPKVLDLPRLTKASAALANTKLVNDDFARVLSRAKAGDFVYLDPPYAPVSATSKFTDYAHGGFGSNEQARLAAYARTLSARGVKVLLSNSDTPEIRALYKGFKISVVQAPRAISARAAGRGAVNELLIEGKHK